MAAPRPCFAPQLKEHFNVPVILNESSTAAQNATAAEFNLKFNLLYTLYSLPNTVRWLLPAAAGASGCQPVGRSSPPWRVLASDLSLRRPVGTGAAKAACEVVTGLLKQARIAPLPLAPTNLLPPPCR